MSCVVVGIGTLTLPFLMERVCITSPNFPASYDASESCVITVDFVWTGVLDLRSFSVNFEQDYLTVTGASS